MTLKVATVAPYIKIRKIISKKINFTINFVLKVIQFDSDFQLKTTKITKKFKIPL